MNERERQALAEEYRRAQEMHLRALKSSLRIQGAMKRLEEFAEEVRRLPGGPALPPPEDEQGGSAPGY
jgi:hypothetical protein